MREENDVRQLYIPWAIFNELHDNKNYRYADVATWPRMRSRVQARFFHSAKVTEPTREGLYRAIDQSRFGDVLAYLVKKNILADSLPRLSAWLHAIPHTHYVLLKAREEFQDSAHVPFYGAGASYTSFTEALSKAIGEFLERFALLTSSFHHNNAIRLLSFGDKKIPRTFFYNTPRFFSWQQSYCPKGLTSEILNQDIVRDAVFSCVRGESVQHGKKVYIPLQYIQWGPDSLQKNFRGDSYKISPKTTSGAGGGFTLAEATLSGLCELIERDGFLIFWLNRLSPRRVSLENDDAHRFSPRFWEVYRSLSDRGYTIYFLDTTTDLGIPSVACCIIAPLPDGKNAITISGKCHANPVQALERALLEHVAFLSSSPRESNISITREHYTPFANANIGKKERISLWRSGDMTDEILFFITGKEVAVGQWMQEFPPVSAGPEHMLAYILSEFTKKEKESGSAYDVFRYVARDPILKELGYKVVKVIVPALMPLYLKETYAPLDCVRLREVPEKLGYRAASPDCYNPFPHPFG